jgi:signal peptidase I
MVNRIKNLIVENRGFIIFIILMSVFRSSLADWNSVPTGSMKPTIVEGDRIIINKIAYDLHIPFSDVSIARFADPKRGDVIVFNSKVSEKRLVKRVIGVPGDIVSMTNNILEVNGHELEYSIPKRQIKPIQESRRVDLIENLAGIKHAIRVDKLPSRASNFSTIKVPAGMYLALGDNRDNSIDSRYIGFIPRQEIIGRSRKVAMSFDYDDYYLLRKERFWKTL